MTDHKKQKERLNKYVDKEVFVLINLEDGSLPEDWIHNGYRGEITLHSDVTEVDAFLNFCDPENERLVLFHGILTEATSIPEKIDDKQFVIALDNTRPGEARAHEIITNGDAAFLAEEIEYLLDVDPFSDSDIEDYYILYGYEVKLAYTVDADAVDEERVDTCKKLVHNGQRDEEEDLDSHFEESNDGEEEEQEEEEKTNTNTRSYP